MEPINYEVLSLTTNSGETWYFACELLNYEGRVNILGYGSKDKEFADGILKSFLEED